MDSNHILKQIVRDQKQGIHKGICSICSANEFVLEASMEKALRTNESVLIEATANQVNQFGGYTGMKPEDFRDFVFSIAKKVDFPLERIILGGDHLGPLSWKNENSDSALGKSHVLLTQYVMAGFTKIHIDTSMHLADDCVNQRLDTSVIADRAANLCRSAEKAYEDLKKINPSAVQPVYVIGSEVPIPGGSQGEEAGVQVTLVADFEDTVEKFESAFKKYGLENAWGNVIAIVVQPGVEFGDDSIHEYNRYAAKDLCQALKKHSNIVFEGHSTDYQTDEALKQMVEDGIAILKVGPGVTFAFREALFLLNCIENELFRFNPDIQLSNLINILDDTMARYPENWKNHYHGNGNKIRLARKYSLSDRCRYYLHLKEVREALALMLNNLGSVQIPLTLISQFMPVQYNKIRKGLLKNDPSSLIKDRIINILDDYYYATSG